MIVLSIIIIILGLVFYYHGCSLNWNVEERVDYFFESGNYGTKSGATFVTFGEILLIAGFLLLIAWILKKYRRGIGVTILGVSFFFLGFIIDGYGQELNKAAEEYFEFPGNPWIEVSNVFAVASLSFVAIGIIASIAFCVYKRFFAGTRILITRVPNTSSTANGQGQTVRCEKCGSPVPCGDKFCTKCGKEVKSKWLATTCPNCGASVGSSNRYCTQCGAPMQQAKKTVCPECGGHVHGGSKFCQQCGTYVSEN